MDMKISSTIGFERDHNPVLRITDREQFVEQSLANLGPQPPNFQNIVALNRGPLLTEGVEVLPLAPRQVEQQRAGGALIVDVRTDQQFDEAHIAGAVCIPMLRAGFGSKLAWVADHDQDIVFVGRDDADGRQAARLAVAIGLRRLAGFLAGGMTSWRQEDHPTEAVERIALDDLPGRAQADAGLQLLDVRERREWEEGRIPGSLLCTWHDIQGLPAGLDPGRPVAVLCGSGQRAATAASLLRRAGVSEVMHVVAGGAPKWGRLGHPLESGPVPVAA
jgi:rhodanese-related sulfurtransferase